MMINRFNTTIDNITVDTTAADSDAVLHSEFTMGIVAVPAGSAITTLTWYVSDTVTGTFLAAHDEDGNAVSQTVAAEKAYALPAALAGARVIKAVGDAAGTIRIDFKA